MKQENVCKYCNAAFARATTLQTHMCVKKRRHMDIDTAGTRFGLRAFQRFYTLTTTSKKIKSIEEFIESPYYIDFVKFGNHLAILKPVNIEKYIDFVILNGVKLKDWTKDFVYDEYIEDLIKKEPADSAVERAINEIIEWAEKNNIEFRLFFESISENEAAYLIKTGRISPWVLYLASTAGTLMSKFNEDHAKMIGRIIDPTFWIKKFKRSDDDVNYIRNVLDQAGL